MKNYIEPDFKLLMLIQEMFAFERSTVSTSLNLTRSRDGIEDVRQVERSRDINKRKKNTINNKKL